MQRSRYWLGHELRRWETGPLCGIGKRRETLAAPPGGMRHHDSAGVASTLLATCLFEDRCQHGGHGINHGKWCVAEQDHPVPQATLRRSQHAVGADLERLVLGGRPDEDLAGLVPQDERWDARNAVEIEKLDAVLPADGSCRVRRAVVDRRVQGFTLATPPPERRRIEMGRRSIRCKSEPNR